MYRHFMEVRWLYGTGLVCFHMPVAVHEVITLNLAALAGACRMASSR